MHHSSPVAAPSVASKIATLVPLKIVSLSRAVRDTPRTEMFSLALGWSRCKVAPHVPSSTILRVPGKWCVVYFCANLLEGSSTPVAVRIRLNVSLQRLSCWHFLYEAVAPGWNQYATYRAWHASCVLVCPPRSPKQQYNSRLPRWGLGLHAARLGVKRGMRGRR